MSQPICPTKFLVNSNKLDMSSLPNISESDNTQSLELIKLVAPYFRVSKNRADALITEMLKILKEWRKTASKLGISQSEQTRMASAFRLVD